MTRRARVLVSGRVQGVFFRAECARLARGLGVGGFVRNTPDGRVEAAFEGDPSAVEAMVEWCRHGPLLAAVEGAVVAEEDTLGEAQFRVTG